MKRTSKNPAPKSSKPAPKKDAAAKEGATKDAAAPTTAPSAKPRDPRLPAPGATLDREYKGKTYHLKFLDEGGVEVGGKLFGSLSAAARHVTGAASINGFLWAGLLARKAPAPIAKVPTAPKPAGGSNDLATPAGQRAALEAAGLGKKAGRPISKPRGAAKADAPRTSKDGVGK